MKEERNNEIDLLLRRLSRRQEQPVSDADSRIDADHLDADELSAYAENALPAAARSRYTEHLADCSKCREIIVQLSGSVPVVAVREVVTVAEPSVLRKFLASFFSPMVLRYAVPALGLIVVAAIGFVVFQSNRSPARVAQLEGQAQQPAPNQSSEQVFAYDSPPKESASPASARPSDAKTVKEAQEPPAPSAPAIGDLNAATTAPVQKAEPQPAVANAAAAPPSSPSPEKVDEMRVDVQGRRNEQAGAGQTQEVAKVKPATVEHSEQKKAEDFQAARGRAASPAPSARTQRAPADSSFRVAEEEADKDRSDGVIRSVAGKRFRKQGAVWVDTAYNSGNAISNIARSSERYRSLVADEPEIKQIADHLDGPFIVVWKGRTYRIQ